MTVYLIHLDKPLSRGTNGRGVQLQANHYIGYATDLARRIGEHKAGQSKSARFLQVCHERGIGFFLSRVWDGEQATRSFERRLKNWKKARQLCPICCPDAHKHAILEDSL